MYIPSETGHWVSEDFERLASVIKDYDFNLELRWIPTDKRTREDKKPYVIMDTLSNTPVLFASELDTPVDILERLFMADNGKGNVLSKIDARNNAQQAMNMKAQMDIYEELHDMAGFLMGNKSKHYVKMGNGVKLDDQRRRME